MNEFVTAAGEGSKIYAKSQNGTFKEYLSKIPDQAADKLSLPLDLNMGKLAKLYLSDNEGIVWNLIDSSVTTVGGA